MQNSLSSSKKERKSPNFFESVYVLVVDIECIQNEQREITPVSQGLSLSLKIIPR